MRLAVKITTSFAFFLALSLQAQTNVQESEDLARREEAFREMRTLELHDTLQTAAAAQKRGDINGAAQDYWKAVGLIPLVEVGNPAVDLEKKAAIKGLDDTREFLAREAMKSDNLAEASDQVANALKSDPTNERLLILKKEIELKAAAEVGKVPSPEAQKERPNVEKIRNDVAIMVQDGKLLYELGRYDDAEIKLKQALKMDPSNTSVPYYLDLIQEARYMDAARRREIGTKKELLDVEKEWLQSTKAESLPQPNAWANTNLVYTSKGRQTILYKLQIITLEELDLGGENGLPLSEVLRFLKDESRKRDLEGKGINFSYNSHAAGTAPAGGLPDAALPVSSAVDAKEIIVKINPPLDNLTLLDALDAICKVADLPAGAPPSGGLAYTIDDYAIWFFIKPPQAVPLYTKTFHVDPNTFIQGLQVVAAATLTGSGGTTGGGGGGGGFGGGGGGFGGGGG
ncbi:MAG: hypothetical protein ABSF38_15625, partial [Verrucomicrobiota bacterium]